MLAFLGYKPLFDFSYSNPLVHTTLGVNDPTQEVWTPDWAGNANKIYSIDVEGWRDRYIQMPEGANEDVLRVEFFGETETLVNDTVRDGSNSNGTWKVVADSNDLKGEFVGRYQDYSNVDLDQVESIR